MYSKSRIKRTLVRYRNSAFRRFVRRHEKYAPVLFFIGGFIFDSLTLGRIDRLYDLSILCSHMTLLSVTLYLFNRVSDGVWKNTILERYEEYFPLAIQFFFGALSSAYVVYFSRSVSLSKTAYFFIILVLILFANEFLKRRISNKYLQFGVYSFLSFTFFAFIIPVFIKEMSTDIFYLSGGISLFCTLLLMMIVYTFSVSTRNEIHFGKLLGLVLLIYLSLNAFYFFRLIPPVPIALNEAIVAHHIERTDKNYIVTYEKDEWYIFWRKHRDKFNFKQGDEVYIFSSVFAPTDLEKNIFHRWKWFNPQTELWEQVEDIGYEITGGRAGGYRGYTYKSNLKKGNWSVEVLTEEELILGVIDFEIVEKNSQKKLKTTEKKF